jgi:hypothetical protein
VLGKSSFEPEEGEKKITLLLLVNYLFREFDWLLLKEEKTAAEALSMKPLLLSYNLEKKTQLPRQKSKQALIC